LYNKGSERQDDLGLNVYHTRFRILDQSTGRWWQVDPKADKAGQEIWSPYEYSFDNPVRYNDPNGDCIPCKQFWNSFKQAYASNFASLKTTLTTNPLTTLKGITANGALELASNTATLGGYGIVKQNLALGKAVINKDAKGAGAIFGDAAANVTQAAVVAGVAKGINVLKGNTSSGLGDLTKAEVKGIQSVVESAERPLEVGGSAASGTRRGVGTNLPIGKGQGTRSDIDYIAPPSSLPYFEGYQNRLPSIDPSSGIIPGLGNPNIGPIIRFEPNAKPVFIPMNE
jgi:RHS repeat-associated protein